MVDKNLIRSLGVTDEEVSSELAVALGNQDATAGLDQILQESSSQFQVGSVLTGRIVTVTGNDVFVEVGLKSEGVVDLQEFSDPSEAAPGTEIEVYLEAVESTSGLVVLSKRRADRIRAWEDIIATKAEGDVVTGTVSRKIKGGLLVDIGVPVFLPASQVDVRRPPDVGEYVGRQIEAKILKIDKDTRNIVVSRRKLIEEQRKAAKEKVLVEVEPGQIRKGVVKNIADFGVFVDLGGIDGLLHITDMSWGRIGHPSEMVRIDETLEVVILNVDREKEKIALGLKQRTPSPWENIEDRYPVNSRVRGTAVNIVPYGVFVKLEEGIEGLVHISEMSWTKRINHPSEVVSVGDEVDVVVLEIDKKKQEISLGMKQTEVNPWTLVKEKYPPGTVVSGKIRNLTNYGAFVEIEEGIDGLLHVSDLSWTRKVAHPSEMLKKGQELRCVVLEVDEEKTRVALGLRQLTEDPWLRQIPQHYIAGQIVRGKVTKVTNFGVFVELEEGLEGLLHISELADHKVDNPEDVVKVGEEIEVKILRVDSEERKIGLSLKRAQWAAEDGVPGETPVEPVRRRGGLDADSGLLGLGDERFIPATRPEEPQAEEEAPPQRTAKKVDQKTADEIALEALGEGGPADEKSGAPEENDSSESPEPTEEERDT
ncbi:MAG TPA: 30S ribosomal protein S1 [Phycisphaerae bacterium]|nr:30S ribosomal protein S1 [Phycisphaerae bacterium]